MKRIFYSLALIPFLAILLFFGWFFTIVFEGEKPVVGLDPIPEYLPGDQTFNLKVEDQKRGLKAVKISISQEGREVKVLEEKFPFTGLLNRQGTHIYQKGFKVNPATLNLAQGRADLKVQVWDYSRRNGGDGNIALIQHQMTVDTIPPSVRAMSRMHNINQGGSGLVIYQTSSDTLESGLYVDDLFFQGFPSGTDLKKGYHVCYFALPHDSNKEPSLFLWARDKAGNVSKASFYYHIIRKRFRSERMNISDRFLERVLPYFSFYPLNSEDTPIKKYLKINNELRKKNNSTFRELGSKSVPEKRWEGRFLRLKNAATMARFADRRLYYYKGEKVDEQTHMGVDLASLASSPIQASNNGRVIFADRLGIYGSAVVLDHGQGLASIYGHLSKISVTSDQEVKKGQTIGYTGQTGLAGGDHLHFGIMVQGVFVNPVEWWDGHWIKDNISRKLEALKD